MTQEDVSSVFVPKKMFLTKGVGRHSHKLNSFELALRDANIQFCNLVNVSSIFAPNCKIICRKEGVKFLPAGQITFVVMAREATNEPGRLFSSSIGLARMVGKPDLYGYLSEDHGFGQTAKKSADHAEDLAAQMLASTLGIELDPETDWDARKNIYHTPQYNISTTHITQSAIGHKDGLWTTVVAAAVFLL